MPAGLHIVTKRRPGKPVIHYVYAWRGGPCIERIEGEKKPKITAALSDKAAEARRARKRLPQDTLACLIEDFRSPSCAEWQKIAKSTRANYTTWLGRIGDRFGAIPLEVFHDRRIREDVLQWRDQWAHQPRSADAAIQCFARLLSWGYGRGKLPCNVLTDIPSLYDVDRSDLIWEPQHFAIFMPVACVEVQEAVDLAVVTGLRRGDIVELPWTAVGDHAIVWWTNKSGKRAEVTIPLLPEARAVLDRIRARHADEMADRPEAKRKPLPATVLSNSRWQPWTASGFGSRFNDAKVESGLDRNFHDLRGTFATRCMLAGLTDQQIADILGWTAEEVSVIRKKYVNQARVVIELGKRIAAAKV